MPNKDINLLEELDSISQIHILKRGDIDQIMVDFAKRILPSLRIERMNVWLFNPERTALISIGEYDIRTKEFTRDSVLHKHDFPVYFEGLSKNKVILAEDVYTHPLTMEFNDIYSKPHHICSLLDIPIRICGELMGVMCFEKTDTKKTFTPNEQSFCLSLSFVFASTMESRHRRAAQEKLEKAIKEKEILIAEVNHRVKNNFSILISLLRISKNKAKNKETILLLQEYEQRIFSMLKIHELFYQSSGIGMVNLSKYLSELVNELRISFPMYNHCIQMNIGNYEFALSSKKVLNLGLIVTEILLNSIKYAAEQTPNYNLSIEVHSTENNVVLITIGDNGAGFDFEAALAKNTLGVALIKDLADAIDVDMKVPSPNKCYYSFALKIDS